jgi:hypothetical protein
MKQVSAGVGLCVLGLCIVGYPFAERLASRAGGGFPSSAFALASSAADDQPRVVHAALDSGEANGISWSRTLFVLSDGTVWQMVGDGKWRAFPLPPVVKPVP